MCKKCGLKPMTIWRPVVQFPPAGGNNSARSKAHDARLGGAFDRPSVLSRAERTYSARQIKECYDGIGMKTHKEDTQGQFWSAAKK